ncbi:MAG: SulP family inorganic anion transporter [Planctomycetota bacterium]
MRQLIIDRYFSNVRGDLLGGITAGIVALPLALAFGITSGLENGAAAGLYGAACVGILAAMFGGTPSQVSGPTGPMTVVVAALAVQLGDPGLVFAAVVLSGLLQIAVGIVRLGGLIRYVPYPVVSGFMSGIGVIIIMLQLPVLLGLEAQGSPLGALESLTEIGALKPAALLLGLATIALVYGTRRVTKAVPGTLVALVVGTIVAVVLGLDVTRIGSIPTGLPSLRLPGWDALTSGAVIKGALVLAALASVDSLLTSLVADRITGDRHDSDQELVGQGIGNLFAGLVGGLPGAGATMRTVVNVQSGGRRYLAGIVHGVLLLAIMLGLAPLAEGIPRAVLAGILVTVGVGILDLRGLRDAFKVPRGDAIVMATVLLLTVFVDLMWAVATGVVLSSLMFAKRLGDRGPAPHEQSPPPAPVALPEEVAHVRLGGTLFFGNAASLPVHFDDLAKARAVVLDLHATHTIDQSGLYALADLIGDLTAREVAVFLAHAREEVKELLTRLGIAGTLVPHERVFDIRCDAFRAATEAVEAAAPALLPVPVEA